jgi:uncharacterized RDD family membrane protein YckC
VEAERPATFDQRLLAQSLDITFLLPFMWILDGLWRASGLFWVTCMVSYHAYAVVLELSPLQATIGKKIMGLIVTNQEMTATTPKQVVARNVLKWLSLLPLSAGFFMIYVRKDGKSLHDIISQTKVVKQLN